MLKFSTKGDYGMVFMMELARYYKRRLVSLSELAKRKKLSSNYLHQVVSPLKKKGLILSKEGVNGGYSLTRAPDKISLLEIVEVLEGPLTLVTCQSSSKCPSIPGCDARQIWTVVQGALKKNLEQTRLSDVIRKPFAIKTFNKFTSAT